MITAGIGFADVILYNASLNTGFSIGHPLGPFSLDCQFTDGSGARREIKDDPEDSCIDYWLSR